MIPATPITKPLKLKKSKSTTFLETTPSAKLDLVIRTCEYLKSCHGRFTRALWINQTMAGTWTHKAMNTVYRRNTSQNDFEQGLFWFCVLLNALTISVPKDFPRSSALGHCVYPLSIYKYSSTYIDTAIHRSPRCTDPCIR